MTTFLAACVVASIPLFFATVGELITEKVGNTNLGVEGMMLMGAVMAFVTAYSTHSAVLTILVAVLAGVVGAFLYAFLTISLRANQIVTGLTLTIFGTGFAKFVGQPYLGKGVPTEVTTIFVKRAVPLLSDIPFIGPILFNQDIFVYSAYVVCIIAAVYMYKTRMGLNLKAVGENTAAADASGINVTLYKYVHVLIGGALCGLGGAYLSIVRVPLWQEDIVNGRGWIAVALVIFVAWNPVKAFFGAILFGGLSILGMQLQVMGVSFSQYIFDMVPYLCTILIVVLSTSKKRKEGQAPADLSNNYFSLILIFCNSLILFLRFVLCVFAILAQGIDERIICNSVCISLPDFFSCTFDREERPFSQTFLLFSFCQNFSRCLSSLSAPDFSTFSAFRLLCTRSRVFLLFSHNSKVGDPLAPVRQGQFSVEIS